MFHKVGMFVLFNLIFANQLSEELKIASSWLTEPPENPVSNVFNIMN